MEQEPERKEYVKPEITHELELEEQVQQRTEELRASFLELERITNTFQLFVPK